MTDDLCTFACDIEYHCILMCAGTYFNFGSCVIGADIILYCHIFGDHDMTSNRFSISVADETQAAATVAAVNLKLLPFLAVRPGRMVCSDGSPV